MKYVISLVFLVFNLLATELPSKNKFDLYLLIGQSNMAGRGNVSNNDKKPVKRVLMLNKSNEWVSAVDPIHFDKKIAGVGPGRSFGIEISKIHKDKTIGLIPCAVGGSPISTWAPGVTYKSLKVNPYDDMLKRTKLAMQKGTLKGIIFHQGESDSNKANARLYYERIKGLFKQLRSDLAIDSLPIVIGQLGYFQDKDVTSYRKMVDRAQQKIAKEDKYTAFVDSIGLFHKGDKAHFSADSSRELGVRYAYAMLLLQQGKYQFVDSIPLWDNWPSFHEQNKRQELSTIRWKPLNLYSVKTVSVPKLDFYPAAANKTGQVVIVCPGGGYSGLAYDKEGVVFAKWFNSIGVSAFVLKYRMPRPELSKNAIPMPLEDIQRTISMIRSQAKIFDIDPKKIGVMGFSAGGHLAASAAVLWDKSRKAYEGDWNTVSVRPDFAILAYPVISMSESFMHGGSMRNLLGSKASEELKLKYSPDKQVDKQTPPTFLMHAKDDRAVQIKNSEAFYKAMQTHKVKGKLLSVDKGGHGFGMGKGISDTENWISELQQWLTELNK